MKKFFLIVLNLFFFCLAKPISANEVLFSESFDTDLSKWEVVRGSVNDWTIQNGLLSTNIPQQFSIREITPKNEFWPTNTGYRLDFDYKPTSGADKNFGFNFRDINNWYEFHFSGDNLYLTEASSGNYTNHKQVQYPLPNGTTYHISIEVGDSSVTLSVDNVPVLTYEAQSLENNVGKFTLKAGTGAVAPTNVSFDNIVVTSLDDKTLGVNLIKQNELPWGPLEYDSATQWTTAAQGSTFSDWACALTSAVMIMHYYGINQMPDGSPITPLSLNNWLLEQENGYIDGGNVNFPMIAALTKTLSNQYDHVALEYVRNESTPREAALTEIAQGKPVIVTKPGHFMIADGIVPDSDDLFIKDPIFSYTKFSEHAAAQTSTRIFTPSHTDVSYLSIFADPSVEVQLYDVTNHLIETTPVIEQLSNDSGSMGPAVRLIEIPKPAAGVYRVQLIYSGEGTQKPTSISTITPSGQISNHSIPVTETQAQLTIATDAPSTIEYTQPEGFEKIREMLARLQETGGIKSQPIFLILDGLASIGSESSNKTEQLLVIKVMKRVTTSFYAKRQLTTAAQAEILKELSALQAEIAPPVIPTPSPKPTPKATPKQTPKPTPRTHNNR